MENENEGGNLMTQVYLEYGCSYIMSVFVSLLSQKFLMSEFYVFVQMKLLFPASSHIYIIAGRLCLLLYYYASSYVRAEVLAGFVNGLFLVFISFFIFSEAVEVIRIFCSVIFCVRIRTVPLTS